MLVTNQVLKFTNYLEEIQVNPYNKNPFIHLYYNMFSQVGANEYYY